MAWGNITGEEKMGTSGGNEIILESDKPKKVVLMLTDGEEPYSFFQHTFEVEKFEGGQATKMFRTVNCPKTKNNPHAFCPLCDGQQAPRRIRHASRAFDIDSATERYLAGGEQVWKPIATAVKMGIVPGSVVWGIMKTGKDRNDTTYSATNLGPITVPIPAISLQDPSLEYKPHTIDEMKAMVESLGLDWNTVTNPPALSFQTSLQEALDHVVPNTKCKGMKMSEIWETNKGMIEFFSNSNRVTPEKAAAQIILVNLGGANIPGVPNFANCGTATPPVQSTPQAPSTPQTPTQTPPAQAVSGDRQAKINEINNILATNNKFVKGGYNAIVEVMKEASNGKTAITDFNDAEIDKMLELCKA